MRYQGGPYLHPSAKRRDSCFLGFVPLSDLNIYAVTLPRCWPSAASRVDTPPHASQIPAHQIQRTFSNWCSLPTLANLWSIDAFFLFIPFSAI